MTGDERGTTVGATYEKEADALFLKAYGKKQFGLEPGSLFSAHDGVERTAADHFEHMVAHIKAFASEDAPGFAASGVKEGVAYEMQ